MFKIVCDICGRELAFSSDGLHKKTEENYTSIYIRKKPNTEEYDGLQLLKNTGFCGTDMVFKFHVCSKECLKEFFLNEKII